MARCGAQGPRTCCRGRSRLLPRRRASTPSRGALPRRRWPHQADLGRDHKPRIRIVGSGPRCRRHRNPGHRHVRAADSGGCRNLTDTDRSLGRPVAVVGDRLEDVFPQAGVHTSDQLSRGPRRSHRLPAMSANTAMRGCARARGIAPKPESPCAAVESRCAAPRNRGGFSQVILGPETVRSLT